MPVTSPRDPRASAATVVADPSPRNGRTPQSSRPGRGRPRSAKPYQIDRSCRLVGQLTLSTVRAR